MVGDRDLRGPHGNHYEQEQDQARNPGGGREEIIAVPVDLCCNGDRQQENEPTKCAQQKWFARSIVYDLISPEALFDVSHDLSPSIASLIRLELSAAKEELSTA